MINTLFAVALITFKEGLRYRILYGILISAMIVMTLSVLLSGLYMRDIAKVGLDLCLASVSIGGLLVPFFLTISLLAKDIESKTIYTLLTKPISRRNYVLGKFMGLSLIAGLIICILTLATLLTTYSSTQLYPEHFFKNLSYLPILTNAYTAFLGVMVLNSVVFLWCSLTTSSFLATLLTICTYIIGQSVEDMTHFISLKTPGVEISTTVQFVVKAALYLFPNLATFDTKLYAAHSIPMRLQEFVALTVYGSCYIAIMLIISIKIFSRRDLS